MHFSNKPIKFAQPAETVRSLTESKQLLAEARREINESQDRSRLRRKHTITRLPGFFPRKAEMLALERALEGEPSFTILCGASAVGKVRCLSLSHPSSLINLYSKCIFRPHSYEKFFRVKNTTFSILIFG